VISLAEFQQLAVEEVARFVRESGPKVCVFPINGTRRWFLLEHPSAQDGSLGDDYVTIVTRRHVELYKMLFRHGLDTLLTPVFGPDLLERGSDYVRVAAEGLSRLATQPELLAFYDEWGVRIRFYGDHRRFLGPTPHAYLSDLFDDIAARTAGNGPYRLFFGVFAHDASQTIAEQAIRYHARHGRVPDRQTLIRLYYGEAVGNVDLFIGFDKLCAFDMPLVATGNEDLYFTVSPSLYLTESQLRGILYDHLVSRRQEEHDYGPLRPQDWEWISAFYGLNMGRTLGIGLQQHRGGFWYPLPQVQLPPGFVEAVQQ